MSGCWLWDCRCGCERGSRGRQSRAAWSQQARRTGHTHNIHICRREATFTKNSVSPFSVTIFISWSAYRPIESLYFIFTCSIHSSRIKIKVSILFQLVQQLSFFMHSLCLASSMFQYRFRCLWATWHHWRQTAAARRKPAAAFRNLPAMCTPPPPPGSRKPPLSGTQLLLALEIIV